MSRNKRSLVQESSPSFRPDHYPASPGVYLFKDEKGRIIYVGKANSLSKRLSAYFRPPEQLSPKTRVMMGRVRSIDTLCTTTEKEALLLESSLIKKHRPRYNVILRDDKSYVLFRLDKSSSYARLQLTRRVQRDGSVYFGPFTSALQARQTLKAVNQAFPLRKCKDRVFANRTRPCLQYDMGRCLAPCVRDVSKEEYEHLVRQLELFLSGRSGELINQLRREMKAAAARQEFEKAARLRDQIRAVEATVEQQTVVFPDGGDRDIVGLARTEAGLAIGVLFIRQGKLLDQRSFFWNAASEDGERDSGLESGADSAGKASDPGGNAGKTLPGSAAEEEEPAALQTASSPGREAYFEDDLEALRSFLVQFYGPGRFIPQEIVLPFKLEDGVLGELLKDRRGGKVHLKVAYRKTEQRLLRMAKKNALQGERKPTDLVPDSLASKLRLPGAPKRIEAVDASHLSGEGMVVGQVVVEEGRLKKEDYRLYAFPELEGTRDDYAALAGWMKRRIRSGPPWPDLVLVDGGKGQLLAVQKGLEELAAEAGAMGETALAAIAKGAGHKGSQLDQVYLPNRKNPLQLRQGSAELRFLQYLRDNVHRFVLSRHKRSRKKRSLDSRLESLPGIGPKTAEQLWERFGSVQAMSDADIDALLTLPGVGRQRAQKLQRALQTLRNEAKDSPCLQEADQSRAG